LPSPDKATQSDILSKVCSSDKLPSVPGVAMHVITISADPNVDFGELTACVSADPALAAKLLRMANSSLFASRSRITTVRNALVRLGVKVTRIAVLSFSLAMEVEKKAPEGFDMDRFWRHALATASAAKIFAQAARFARTDDAFANGLLQDVGVLAFQCTIPEEYATVLAVGRAEPGRELASIEEEKLSTTHMEVGSVLLKSWKLPAEMYEPIFHHHAPDVLQKSGKNSDALTMARLLHLGARVGRLFNDPAKGILLDSIIRQAKRDFDLSEDATLLNLEKVQNAVRETASIFSIDEKSVESYAEIQAQASHEIARIAVEMDAESRSHQEEAVREAERLEKLEADNESLRHAAAYDGLTGLLVRREFMKHVDQELNRARRHDLGIGLLLADVDNFKRVNDTFGHLAGDVVLQNLGQYLAKAIRTSDIVARYGGEEFVALLPHSGIESALEVAERLRLGVAENSAGWYKELGQVTISVGAIHISPARMEINAEGLIAEADKCLYAAKDAGRNCTRYLDLDA